MISPRLTSDCIFSLVSIHGIIQNILKLDRIN